VFRQGHNPKSAGKNSHNTSDFTVVVQMRLGYTRSMNDDALDPKMNPTETLRRALGDRYLTYALSTIMHRALPDARDGLKPVHRRILYAMRELKLASNGGFRKSAKISGDVMGI
jgi:topoisomerase-4 subunit A